MKSTLVVIRPLIIFLSGTFLFISLSAQDPIWKFVKTTSGSQLVDVKTDSVGNSYMIGYYNTSSFGYGNDSIEGIGGSGTSAFVLKTNAVGELQWIYPFYGLNDTSVVRPVKLRINEHGDATVIFECYNVAFVRTGNDTIVLSAEGTVTFVTKIDKNSTISWTRQVIANPYNLAPGVLVVSDMFIDEPGRVFLTGYFEGESVTMEDEFYNFVFPGTDALPVFFVGLIEANGNIGWLEGARFINYGDTSAIRSFVIRDNPVTNSIIIGGTYEGMNAYTFGDDTISFAQNTDAFLASFSKIDGNPDWVRPLVGTNEESVEDIALLNNGDIIYLVHSNSAMLNLYGDTYAPEGVYNLYLARFSSAGDYIRSSEITIEKNILEASGTNAFMRVTDSQDLILGSEFRSLSVFNGVYSLLNTEAGSSDMFIARLNSTTFAPVWTFHGRGPSNNVFEAWAIDRFGNVFLAGTTPNDLMLEANTIPGNPSQGTSYTARLNSAGSIDHVFYRNNTLSNQLRFQYIGFDVYGNTFTGGRFLGADNLGAIPFLTLDGAFLAKYSYVRDISGIAVNGSAVPITEGYVKVYGYTLFQRSPLNDSIPLADDGTFMFHDIPFGNYLLVVQPTGDAQQTYSPTYYPSDVYWEFAQQVHVNNNYLNDFHRIMLKELEEFTGNTEVSGNVTDSLSEKMFNYFEKGRPVKKAKIVLAGTRKKQDNYDIITTVETDALGNFTFNDIENGSYYVWADIPGLPVEDVYEIIVAGHTFVSNLDYIVTDEVVRRAGVPNYSGFEQDNSETELLVFPNPASDYIRILSGLPARIEIIDLEGTIVKQIKLSSNDLVISIQDLLPGTYILRILSDEKISINKISIVR